jgi:hypothetical protein
MDQKPLSELESLQETLNLAINAFRNALTVQGLPEPTLTTCTLHPMDVPNFLPSPEMFEAQKVALASIVGFPLSSFATTK